MGTPSVATVKRLFALSGNHCAFPECKNRLIDEKTNALAARICHIKGNREGSARYDKKQPEEERQSFGNLVAMCPIHSDIIDNKANIATYTVEWLVDVKQKHESKFRGAPSPTDDLAEQFAVGTLYPLGLASVVILANQSGGQTANTINNYQFAQGFGSGVPAESEAISEDNSSGSPLSELEFDILVVVGKLRSTTVPAVASAVHVTEEKAEFYLEELSRKHKLLRWFGNMDPDIPDRYMLTHRGRGLLVERGVFE